MKNGGQYHWLILYKWKHQTFKATVRPNVDPTFIRSWDPNGLGGTTMTPLFSRIHTSLINIWTTISQALVWVWPQWENKMEHLTIYLHIPRTTKYTHTHTHTHTYIYIYIYVCMYIHIIVSDYLASICLSSP